MIPAAKPLIGDEERAAVDRVLRSGMIAQGPEVAAFEQEFADQMVGGRTCVAVNAGTTGLHLGLLAAGIVVRDVGRYPRLGDALRITIGTAEENNRVLAVLNPAMHDRDAVDGSTRDEHA